MPVPPSPSAPVAEFQPRADAFRVLIVMVVLMAAASAAGFFGWLSLSASLGGVALAAFVAGAAAATLRRGPTGRAARATRTPTVAAPAEPSAHCRETPEQPPPRAVGQSLRGLFEDGPIGIAIVTADGTVADSNRAFRALLAGDAAAALSEEDVADLFAVQDGGSENDGSLETALASPVSASVEVAFGPARSQSGTVFLGPLEQDRRVLHLIDTTHQKKLEVQFAQSQKMLAVGKLAGGIAHDFNNLLTAMTGFCDLLLLRHQPGDPSFADIMQIKHNANRAANLVRQLLAFSRQQTLQPRVMTLADVISDISNLLRRLIGAGIELRVEHGADVCPVRVDRVQLEQVLINLAVNARDAMQGTGVLTIRTRDVQPSQVERQHREPPLAAGRWVLIEVQDNGPGIPAKDLERIFDPFFTTKPVGEGTGLGLSTAFGIVKQTDGYIYAENALGGGALFSVYLPAHTKVVAERQPVAPSRADLTGDGRILLVEDEDPVRMFGARALRSKGYKVTEARTGQAALSLLGQGEEPFDLLITDVIMPEMDGPSLIEHVRANRPDMRVICISGYAESTFRDKLDEFGDLHFLAKPFTLQQLAGKVKEVMAA